MANSFEESVDEAQSETNETHLSAGDECPETCDHEVRELRNERNPQLGTSRHPDSNAVEMVCVDHGIVETR